MISRATRPDEIGHDSWLRVDDIATVAAVRRWVTAGALGLGFSEERVAHAGIVASELATNLVRHAGGGQLVLRCSEGEAAHLRLLAIDSGPGRRNIQAMIADGRSSIGTLGIGLGACARLANHFDVHSAPGVGTIVELVVCAEAGEATTAARAASLTRPLEGEMRCGDTAAYRVVDGRVVGMLADGLGHGTLAAHASRRAADVLHDNLGAGPAELLSLMHRRLGDTRGAAIAVVTVDTAAGEVVHAGVGNISVRLLGGRGSQSFVSQPGIVGHRMPRVREMRVAVEDLHTLVMHSDGISQHWSPDDLAGSAAHSPAITCAALVRAAASGRDDAGALAVGLSA